jgi:hypothetical protein
MDANDLQRTRSPQRLPYVWRGRRKQIARGAWAGGSKEGVLRLGEGLCVFRVPFSGSAGSPDEKPQALSKNRLNAECGCCCPP